MKLYYHQTGGGAEYYSTKFVTCPNGEKEGIFAGVVLRTDGNEIEVLTRRIFEQGFKFVIDGVTITPETLKRIREEANNR